MPPRGPKIREYSIYQQFVDERCPDLSLRVVPEKCADAALLDWLLQDEMDNTRLVGMHPSYTKSGLLAALAICIRQKIVIITEIMKARSPSSPFRYLLDSKLLSHAGGFTVVAFNGHELALALYKTVGLNRARVIDILSLSPQSRDVVQTVKRCTRAKVELFEAPIRNAFLLKVHANVDKFLFTLAQQAWFAYYIGDHPVAKKDVAAIPIIDISLFEEYELQELSKGMVALLVQDLVKPLSKTYELPSGVTYDGAKATWSQDAYGKRLQNSPHLLIKANTDENVTLTGDIVRVKGKQATVQLKDLNDFLDPKLRSITVTGKARPTRAEQGQTSTILSVLQRKLPLFDDYWMKRLYPSYETRNINKILNDDEEDGWAAAGDDPWTTTAISPQAQQLTRHNHDDSRAADGSWAPDRSYEAGSEEQHLAELAYKGPLNASQEHAVRDILDMNKDVTIVQGPPGTGKTTVIAAYLAEVLSRPGKACLVIAQSNIAIKNVAEKLFCAGITDWVLLVSSEFLTGWHEHLYEHLPAANIVSSSNMRHPLRARAVLCTLSMLSSPRFTEAARGLCMESLIVEEASQVPLTSYMSMFVKYGKQIKKITFIGDDKQLPPFASEMGDGLSSVFENKPLLETVQILFLNIQYRMPPAIGDFLSREVYTSLLQSWEGHPVQSPISTQFLNVHGAEELDKKSFINSAEASVAISIATLLNEKYKTFKIITPYESQRDLLEHMLKEAGLQWANTCFTVDAFQGNEGDYIIISIVRTRSVGFLQDLRRSNVMLSRAKRGMFICTNWSFLQSPGARYTLIGRMSEEWAQIEGGWIEDVQKLAEQLYIE